MLSGGQPDDTHIAAGMTDGTLAVRRRDPKPAEATALESKQAAIAGGSYEYFADMEAVFGTGYVKPKAKDLLPVVGPADEFKVETRRQVKLKEFDKMLKAFKYSAALDAALTKVRATAIPLRGVSADGPDCPADNHFCPGSGACQPGRIADSPVRAGRHNARARFDVCRPAHQRYPLRSARRGDRRRHHR